MAETKDMLDLLGRVAATRLLVVGDAMLDHYVFGDAARLSPEAPVPVVRVERDVLRPGGAANTPGALMTTAAAELAVHGHASAAADLYSRAAAWYDEQPADRVASVAQRNWRTFTLIGAERWQDAKPVCESLLEDAPDEGWFHTMDGYVAARLGDQERARSQLRWLEGQEDTRSYQGTLHAVLGDKARAVELLTQDFAEGAYATLWWHRDVLLIPLVGDDPAYAELVRPKG